MPDTYRVEHPASQFPFVDRFVLDTDDAAVADRVGQEMPGSVMTEDVVQSPQAKAADRHFIVSPSLGNPSEKYTEFEVDELLDKTQMTEGEKEAAARWLRDARPGAVRRFSAGTITCKEGSVLEKQIVTKLPGVSRLVCLDVGGVLASKDTDDDYSHLEPLEGCREFLEQLAEHKVGTVVNSAHPADEVTEWLRRYGLLDLISGGAQLGDQRLPQVVQAKPRAEKYIDDRMVRYKGDYDEALEAILDFEPWWHDGKYEVDSVALDFDGTLNVYGTAGTEDEFNAEPPEPQEGAREFVAKLYSKVGRVVIFSARPTRQIEAWLTKWRFDRHIDAVEDHKPKVKVYLDDRGMRFKGKYDKILDKLRLLEPVTRAVAGGVLGVNSPPGNSTATPRVYGEPQTKEASEVPCPECNGRGTQNGGANCRTCLGSGKVQVADDKNKRKTMPGEKASQEASIVIVKDGQGRVLTVTRPDSPEQALPGGLVDPGETPLVAAQREVLEETGVKVTSLGFLGTIKSSVDGRTVNVYRTYGFEGEANDAEGAGKVTWLTPEELLAQSDKYKPSVQQLMPHMKAPVAPFPTLPPAEEFGERVPRTAKPEMYANGFATPGDDVGVEKGGFKQAVDRLLEDRTATQLLQSFVAGERFAAIALRDRLLEMGVDLPQGYEGMLRAAAAQRLGKSAEVQPISTELMGDRFGNSPWNLASQDGLDVWTRSYGTAEGVQPSDLSHAESGTGLDDAPVQAQSISKVGPEGSPMLFTTPDQTVAGVVEGADRDTAKVRVTSVDRTGRFAVGDTVMVPGTPDDRTEMQKVASGPEGPGPALMRFSDDPTITRDIKAAYREGYAAAQNGERQEDNPYIVGEPYKSAGWTAGWQDGSSGSAPQVKDKDGELYPEQPIATPDESDYFPGTAPDDHPYPAAWRGGWKSADNCFHPVQSSVDHKWRVVDACGKEVLPTPFADRASAQSQADRMNRKGKTSPYSTERREDGWWTVGPVGTWNEHGPFDSWEQADSAADRLLNKSNMDEYPSGENYDWRMGKALSPEEAQRARAADLVVLPDDIPGTSCQNCEYSSGDGHCEHPKVDQHIEPHWCCIYWDRPGTERVAEQQKAKSYEVWHSPDDPKNPYREDKVGTYRTLDEALAAAKKVDPYGGHCNIRNTETGDTLRKQGGSIFPGDPSGEPATIGPSRIPHEGGVA